MASSRKNQPAGSLASVITRNEKSIHETWADTDDTLPIVGAREFYKRPAPSPAKPMTPTEEHEATKATAVELHEQGATHRQIADSLGIERSRVSRLIKEHQTPPRRLDIDAIHQAIEDAPCAHCGGHEPKFRRNGAPIRSCNGCYRKKVSEAARRREQEARAVAPDVETDAVAVVCVNADPLGAAIEMLRSVTLGQIARESHEMQLAVAGMLLAADRREGTQA